MDMCHLKDNIKKLVAQRNIFLCFSALLSVAVILLATLLFTKKERTILVPLSGASLWIGDGKASVSYLEKMGVFLSDLLLNRTPSDVEWKNQTILEHVHPHFYHQIKKTLTRDKEDIIKHQQTFVFQAERSFVEESNRAFVIEGNALVLVSKNGQTPVCSQKDRRTYRLGFQCKNGKVLLVSLTRGEAEDDV